MRDICFFEPSLVKLEGRPKAFEAISVTGNSCALMCPHCRGIILQAMIPAITPREFVEVCRKLRASGCQGILVSGGCNAQGRVPLAPFSEAIRCAKRLGLHVVAHTGLVDEETVNLLARAGVDVVMLDVIGSSKTVRLIYGLNATPEDYRRSLLLLKKAGLTVAPHIVVGLHYGRIVGEPEALRIVAESDPDALVIVVLTPLPETLVQDPPPLADVVAFMRVARRALPDTPLLIGCMRPRGPYREKLDRLAVELGFNGIAYPSRGLRKQALESGLRVRKYPLCCSLITKLR